MIQFIVGEKDEICTVEQAEKIVNEIPAVATTMHVVEDVDHRQLISNGDRDFVKGLIRQIEYSPCGPPESVTPPTLENQYYTISDKNAAPYTIDDFIVVPDFCGSSTEVDVSPLFNGKSAITVSEDKKSFSFFYDDDLEPLGWS